LASNVSAYEVQARLLALPMQVRRLYSRPFDCQLFLCIGVDLNKQHHCSVHAQMLESCPPHIQRLLRSPMERVTRESAASCKSAVSAAVDRCMASNPPSVRDWAGAGPTATAVQMAVFSTHLAEQGLKLQDLPGSASGNNSAYLAVMHQVPGLQGGAGQRDSAAQRHRLSVLDFLTQVTALELAGGEEAYIWVAEIQAVLLQHGLSARDAVAAHLAGVWAGDQSTNVELSALAVLVGLEARGVPLLVYNPLYAAEAGYHKNLTGASVTQAQEVLRVALVPAGGAGDLNRFAVVQLVVGEGGASAKRVKVEG